MVVRLAGSLALAIMLSVSIAYGAAVTDPAVFKGNCGDTIHGPGCSDAGCEQCVCAVDPNCCSSDWNTSCVLAANISGCTFECFAVKGNCADPRPEPGCSDATCEACVCGLTPACCTAPWSIVCVFQSVTTGASGCFGACRFTGAASAPALSIGGVAVAGLLVLVLGVRRLRARRG